MTREEAIKVLKENYAYYVTYDSGDYEWGDDLAEAVKMAIKALEQEPILDKIRAEIGEVYEELDGYDPQSLGTFASRIDEIIDKYKAESEDKE